MQRHVTLDSKATSENFAKFELQKCTLVKVRSLNIREEVKERLITAAGGGTENIKHGQIG